MPRGFLLLIAAQFTSALADNALLIVAIALLQQQGLPGWWAPLLKFSFTLSYVLLAPVVGPLADAVPKARLMAWMNGLKMLGLGGMLLPLHPVLAYAVVGLGAAGYAPAKYGLVTELVPPQRLVAANGWIEVSIVCAALLGTVVGGGLVSAPMQALGLNVSLVGLLALYGLAALLQWGVPDSGARYPQAAWHPLALSRDFWRAHRRLWRDAAGGLSLSVTTLFWGVGAVLQFAVLRWATERVGLGLDQAAYLQAVVALGVVAGAAGAGRFVPLRRAMRVLPAGIALGGLIAAVAPLSTLGPALPLLVLTGAVGGILVVPMNALLQHRGHQLLTAGRSIAVQGFNENLSVLGMLAVYAGLHALALPLVPLMMGFGGLIAVFMVALMVRRGARRRALASGAGQR
ncbi:lysophospholipid transporter LplT [Ideonella sp. B7]|uniref:lysophospholipid transporter LplT n=1 Tax=Ideonella benzenivorans TaxID=2831643 RepID=UPI001CEDA512|nr:lysophospholipid transporter LplT [Ideonella benzenivorans]MCA6215110.1 lysophospholipid transporter LplT [Ideonella benzenivorans]